MPQSIGTVASHNNYKPPTPLVAIFQPTSNSNTVLNSSDAEGPDSFTVSGGSMIANPFPGWSGYYMFATQGNGQLSSNNGNRVSLDGPEYTVEAYVRIDGNQYSVRNSGGSAYIIGNENSYRTNAWALYFMAPSDNQFPTKVAWYPNTTTGGNMEATPTTPLTMNRIYHIAATKSNNVMRLYLEGVKIAEAVAVNAGSIEQSLVGGRRSDFYTAGFNGTYLGLRVAKKCLYDQDSYSINYQPFDGLVPAGPPLII